MFKKIKALINAFLVWIYSFFLSALQLVTKTTTSYVSPGMPSSSTTLISHSEPLDADGLPLDEEVTNDNKQGI